MPTQSSWNIAEALGRNKELMFPYVVTISQRIKNMIKLRRLQQTSVLLHIL